MTRGRHAARRQWLPPPGAARVLVASAFCGSIGTGLFLAGSMLFFTRRVGLSPVQVSLGLTVAAVCGMIASVPVAGLADRLAPQRIMVLLHVWRVVSYALYVVVHSFPAFLLVICATAVADKASPAVSQAMVGELFGKQERLRTMGYLRAVQNVGLSVGALLAASALWWESGPGYDLLALGNAASYVVMAVLVWRIRPGGVPVPRTPAAQRSAPPALARRRVAPGFALLGGLNGLLALHDTVLFVALPLWIADHTTAPVALVSIALVVNTAATAVTQTWWTRLANTLTRATRGMVGAGLLLALASLAVGSAGHAGAWVAGALVLLGVLVLTAGENLHSAAAWEVSFELSPPASRARHLSVFNLGNSVRDILGPVFVTAVVVGAGTWGWIGLAGLFVVAGVASRRVALAVHRRAVPVEADPRPVGEIRMPAFPVGSVQPREAVR